MAIKTVINIYFLYTVALTFSTVNAYELGTHALLTFHAYKRSALGMEYQLLNGLGLTPTASNQFGEVYFDITGKMLEQRKQTDFERSKMPNEGRDFLTIQGWLMRGAIREDDAYKEANPQDDPYPENASLRRPLHHFFDPINDCGLFVGSCNSNLIEDGVFGYGSLDPDVHKAPDWAIGTSDVFIDPTTPEPVRRNHFTVFDAREALYRALTSRNRAGDIVAASEDERNAYWATTFRSLGDVVHLIQDMAQPQHTRNDRHAGKTPESVTGHESVYEKYVDARATGAPAYRIDGTPATPQPLTYGGYPVPEFDDYASFFSTIHLDGPDPRQRRGLADYSNRGFFSAGTNLGRSGYELPSNNKNDYKRQEASISLPEAVPETIRLLVDDVIDTNQPSRTALNVPLSTESAWELFRGTNVPSLSLTRPNYDAMADLLIPRAVAYSAGLLNYFFRGRLDPVIDAYNQSEVSIRFSNHSKNDTIYSDNGAGTLAMTYRFKGANGQWVFGISDDLVSLNPGDDVAAGASSSGTYRLTFTPPIPVEAAQLELRVIFRGRLGNETDAVAVGYEPMTSGGFFVTPSVTPADGITGSRHIYKVDGTWRIAPGSGFAFGRLDWKGHELDDTLSFDGPVSRYLYRVGAGYSRFVYRHGSVWAIVPQGNVIGAGIQRNSTDSSLAAITYSSNTVRVYVRDFAAQYPNNADYSPTNPLGWRLVMEQAVSDAYPATPMFFNASGTTAKGIFDAWSSAETRVAALTLSGTEAGLAFSSQPNTFTQITTKRNHTTSSATAAVGSTTESCGLYAACLAYGCADYPDGCSLQKTEATYRHHRDIYDYGNTPQSAPIIIAVDFQGDREVVATLRAESDHALREESIDTQTDTQQTDVHNCVDSWDSTGTRTTTQSLVSQSSSKTDSSLHVATSAIPLHSDYSRFTLDEQRTYVFDIASNAPTSDRATATSSSNRTLINGKFNFFDLRHNITSYSAREKLTIDAFDGTGDVSRFSYAENVDTSRTTDTTETLRTIVQIDNRKSALYEVILKQPLSTSYEHSLEPLHGDCVNLDTESQTPGTVTRSWTNFLTYLHPEIERTDSGQGYAVDHLGNALISQTIWAENEASYATYTSVGTWNFLSGGDLASLFGITNPNVKFWPVGLY